MKLFEFQSKLYCLNGNAVWRVEEPASYSTLCGYLPIGLIEVQPLNQMAVYGIDLNQNIWVFSPENPSAASTVGNLPT